MITADEARERSRANDRTDERREANTTSLLKACEVSMMEAVADGYYTAGAKYSQPVDLAKVSGELKRLGYNVPVIMGNCSEYLVFGWHKEIP